ncbi:hypothetical protein AB0H00_22255 [Nocardia sp. NPDC023852]|uniref:hypothetical protein n=1 Tax=Nocardia sp. NPDC023852 TaxID=3154697 RepID=UPI0033D4853D
MRIKKFVVTSLLAIAATGIAAGTAHAGPGTIASTSTSGTDRGVTYTSGLSEDRTGVTTTLESGRFALTPDATAVTVTAPDGVVVASLPMSFQASGQQVRLSPDINTEGTALTLRPADKSTAVGDIAEYNQNVAQLKDIGAVGVVGGVVVGAAIGAVIGTLVGALFLVVGAIPGLFIGLVAGAVIGAFVGGVVL